jgi:hypothetical protein
MSKGNPGTTVRLRPVIVAYLDELAAIGGYGKGRSGVMRRFIENGIVRAIEKKVVERKNAADFGEVVGGDTEDDGNDD